MSTYYDDLPEISRGSNPLVYLQDGINSTLTTDIPAGLTAVDVSLADASEFPGLAGGTVECAVINPNNPYQVDEVFYNWSSISGNALKSANRRYGTALSAGSRVIVGLTGHMYKLILECLQTLLHGTRETEWTLDDIMLQRLTADSLKILQDGGGDVMMVIAKILFEIGADKAMIKPSGAKLQVRNEADDDYATMQTLTPTTGAADNDVATVGYVQAYLQSNLHWQEPVLSQGDTTPPGAPTEGDRYILGTGCTGDWAGHDEAIATYEDGAWSFLEAEEALAAYVEDDDHVRCHNGSTWVRFGAIIDHSVLQNIGTYSHSQIDTHIDSTDRHREKVQIVTLAEGATITLTDQWVNRVYISGDGGPVTTMNISAGSFSGQELYIIGTAATNTVSLREPYTAAGNIRLNGPEPGAVAWIKSFEAGLTVEDGGNSWIRFRWDGALWIEMNSYPAGIFEVSGLQAALDAKSDDGHSHVIGDVTALQTALDAKSDTGHTHEIGDLTDMMEAEHLPIGESADFETPGMQIAIAPPLNLDEYSEPLGFRLPYESGEDEPVLSLFKVSPIIFDVSDGKVNNIANADLASGWKQVADAAPIQSGYHGRLIVQRDSDNNKLRLKKVESNADSVVLYDNDTTGSSDSGDHGTYSTLLTCRFENISGASQNIGVVDLFWIKTAEASKNYKIVIYAWSGSAVGSKLWESPNAITLASAATWYDLGQEMPAADRMPDIDVADGDAVLFGIWCSSPSPGGSLPFCYGGMASPPASSYFEAKGDGYNDASGWGVNDTRPTYIPLIKFSSGYGLSIPVADSGCEAIAVIGSANDDIKNAYDGDTTTKLRRVPYVELLDESYDAMAADEAPWSMLPGGKIKNIVTLADDASIDLPHGTSGWGFVMAGDGEEFAHFTWTSAGVVTLGDTSTNVANTDSDTDLCIFDGGDAVTIKNRLGSSKVVKYEINCS